jgi:hypothetical protein
MGWAAEEVVSKLEKAFKTIALPCERDHFSSTLPAIKALQSDFRSRPGIRNMASVSR